MNKNRALLLDRDGVVNVDHGYIGTVERFDFSSGLFPFLRAARDCGYRLAILTNQSGVARGLFAEEDHHRVTAHMLNGLRREGIDVELTLSCFAHPEGKIEAYRQDSFWRKPNPGMVREAVRRLDLAPEKSVFIGDKLTDMQAAQAGGIGRCLWLTTENVAPPDTITVIRNLDEAQKNLF